MNLSAEQICNALPKGRRIRGDQYKACCPAHDDNSPSLSITQKSDRVLLKCWSGCSQEEVLGALQGRGLWPKPREKSGSAAPFYTKDELDWAHLWCLTYRDNVKKGYKPSPEEDAKFRKYSDLCYREGVAYVS
ncbi:CHC2 zinc finger domain-containing protein [Pseudohalioglobus lutimaris]|uniref:Zinc finger CHC2-type domain-containing protein n=1 Tax=Pseudohalioglobus lutimaris TaxID=1737061 RepID=A0A2N5X4N2_9GAMM|nr:CHC2 zinc finger domain-containing protein [Pseudohalioglobus lutimaris]PLW69446.1 hypothetical protein C0039_07930 [Pseudohalioglobus lutimaris]